MRNSSLFDQAQSFLSHYYSESKELGLESRLELVQAEIERTGTYLLTTKELAFGGKVGLEK